MRIKKKKKHRAMYVANHFDSNLQLLVYNYGSHFTHHNEYIIQVFFLLISGTIVRLIIIDLNYNNCSYIFLSFINIIFLSFQCLATSYLSCSIN